MTDDPRKTFVTGLAPRLANRLDHYGARDPQLIKDTHIAQILRVRLKDGSAAALKLYHDSTMGGEASGVRLLAAAQGGVAVPVLGHTRDSLLMPWLEGPRLGDLIRDGDGAKADAILVETALRLHRAVPGDLSGLVPLEDRFQSLFDLRFSWACPGPAKRAMRHATSLARTLLDQASAERALHGDFHHDNVIVTARGPVVFDAKGVFGDVGYELANAFRNPGGAEGFVGSADRAQSLAALACEHLGVAPQTQLAWAAAKCALSIAWRTDGTLSEIDPDIDLLDMFLGLSVPA